MWMETFRPFYLLTFLTLLLLAGCGFTTSPSGDPNGGLRAEAWTPSATPLDTGAVFDVTPQIAVQPNGGGAAIAVWIKREDLDPADDLPAVYHLYAKHSVGGVWDTTDGGCPFGNPDATGNDGICVIDTGSAQYDAWSPKVSMDNNGDAIVVWQQHDGTAQRVYARTFCGSCAAPGWAAAKQLNDSADFGTFDAADPAIAMQPDSTTTTVDSADSTTGWVGSCGAGVGTITLNTTTFIEGTGALNLIKTAAVNADACYYKNNIPSKDITGRQLQVSLFILNATSLAKVSAVRIFVMSDGVTPGFGSGTGCSSCAYKEFSQAQLAVGWNTLTFDPSSPTGSNGINYANITGIRLDIVTVAIGTTYAAGEFIMDYWRVVPGYSTAMAAWSQYYQTDWTTSLDTGAPYDSVRSMAVYNGSLYAGMGDQGTDADVWIYDPGGNSWSALKTDFASNYEKVIAMTAYNGKLYVGLAGTANGNAAVWSYDSAGNVWTDVSNSTITSITYTGMRSMAVYNGLLYIGLASGVGGGGDVFRCSLCDGTDWTNVADAVTGAYEEVPAMAVYNGQLYVGLGNSASTDADVIKCTLCDGTDWTTVLNNGAPYDAVRSMAVHNNCLYVGLGDGSGDGDVMRTCDGTSWTTVFTDGGSTTYEAVTSMVSYNGFLYIGLGTGTAGDGDIKRCSVCDGTDWTDSRADAATYESVFSLAVYDTVLYTGMGSTVDTDGDIVRFSAGWQTMARRCADGGDAGAACGDTASEWATSDTGVCPAGSGLNDGICFISAGTASQPAALPKVAMDDSGRAIAAFVKMVVQADCVEPGLPPPPLFISASINCTDSTLQANLFNGTTWQSAIDLDPGLSSVAASNQLICFENGIGVRGQSGSTDACVNVIEFDLAVSPAGQAALLIKTAWKENEDWNDTGTCAPPIQHAGRCVPDEFAFEDYMGEAIVVRQYNIAAAWSAANWSLNRLANFGYANGTHFGIGPFATGCPSRMIMDGLRVTLNCHFSSPRVAVDNNSNQTAIALYEAYDGTSYDIVAHRFVCTDGGDAGAVCGDTVSEWSTTSVFTMIDAGAGDAHAPQIAMDNSGFGVAVWTQSDGAIFRVNSNCFAPSTGVNTTCGNVATTGWQGADNVDSGVGFESGYFNPVVGLSGPGGANSALSLFLGWSVLDNTTRLYYATGP